MTAEEQRLQATSEEAFQALWEVRKTVLLLTAEREAALKDLAGLIKVKTRLQREAAQDAESWQIIFSKQWRKLENWSRKWDRIHHALSCVVQPKADETICQMAERAAAEHERLRLAYDTLERQRQDAQAPSPEHFQPKNVP